MLVSQIKMDQSQCQLLMQFVEFTDL